MVVTCEHVWRDISNYFEGDVDPVLRQALEEHRGQLADPDAAFIAVTDANTYISGQRWSSLSHFNNTAESDLKLCPDG